MEAVGGGWEVVGSLWDVCAATDGERGGETFQRERDRRRECVREGERKRERDRSSAGSAGLHHW